MSLHAHLSAEAEARLRAQQRNSTISSVLISILFLVLIGLVLGFFLLKPMIKEPPVIVTYQSNVTEDTTLEERKVQTNMERKPSSPSASMTKVIVSSNVSATSIPVPDVDVSTPSLDYGDSDDFGAVGWGESAGGGGGFANVPQTMKRRCSAQDRLARLRETGGSPECEDAVIKALNYLKSTQGSQGNWDPFPAGMTGLALLAYLGHCETPTSPEYGETVSKAISYLVSTGLKNNGPLTSGGNFTGGPPVYEHGIATYALAEAYTLCKSFNITIPDLEAVTKNAGDIILKGQADSGSWLYGYASAPGGDNSVGFWQIQALKACKHTGLWDEKEFRPVIRKAHDWLEQVQGTDGSIGYREYSGASPQLTSGAVLCFQMWDKGQDKTARQGLRYLRDRMAFEWGDESANLYYHYYNAQAMMNHGGSDWKKYNEDFRDKLLQAQNSNGSWSQTTHHGPINDHMATCLATLMLEVYYRFLPGTGSK
jgi:hypothetical protein